MYLRHLSFLGKNYNIEVLLSYLLTIPSMGRSPIPPMLECAWNKLQVKVLVTLLVLYNYFYISKCFIRNVSKIEILKYF